MSLRRYEDDDFADDPPYRRANERSGWVLGLAVVNFLAGGVVTLGGMIVSFIAIIIMLSGRGGDREESVIVFTFVFPALILGVGYLITGFGLLGRRPWARIMTLVEGPVTFIFTAGSLLRIVVIVADSAVAAQGFHDDDIIGIGFIACFGVLFSVAYGVFAYVILLRKQVASEFH